MWFSCICLLEFTAYLSGFGVGVVFSSWCGSSYQGGSLVNGLDVQTTHNERERMGMIVGFAVLARA